MVKINEDACIGCGSCMVIADEVFDMNEDGLAYVKDNFDYEKCQEAIIDAVDNCPTGAISQE